MLVDDFFPVLLGVAEAEGEAVADELGPEVAVMVLYCTLFEPSEAVAVTIDDVIICVTSPWAVSELLVPGDGVVVVA